MVTLTLEAGHKVLVLLEGSYDEEDPNFLNEGIFRFEIHKTTGICLDNSCIQNGDDEDNEEDTTNGCSSITDYDTCMSSSSSGCYFDTSENACLFDCGAIGEDSESCTSSGCYWNSGDNSCTSNNVRRLSTNNKHPQKSLKVQSKAPKTMKKRSDGKKRVQKEQITEPTFLEKLAKKEQKIASTFVENLARKEQKLAKDRASKIERKLDGTELCMDPGAFEPNNIADTTCYFRQAAANVDPDFIDSFSCPLGCTSYCPGGGCAEENADYYACDCHQSIWEEAE